MGRANAYFSVSCRCPLARRQGTECHLLAFQYNLDIQITGVIFGATLGKRLCHIFRNQIKQVVAVNIMLPGRGGIRHMGFNVFNGLAQFFRQPAL
jgi:hypothetical protein